MFRGGVKGTGCPFHSPVSPSLPLPWVAVCRHISTGVYVSEGIRSIVGMNVTGKLRRNSQTLSRGHFVHHKPHMHWPAIETGLPRLEANAWPLVKWSGALMYRRIAKWLWAVTERNMKKKALSYIGVLYFQNFPGKWEIATNHTSQTMIKMPIWEI